ncbi:MAG: GspE/PulE family protein [Candidatus Pacebacteria bacterium]|nr:GspE/PulE family protein [Candidatus Paceibacterota bacterium]MDD5356839.1 GspE/PulE family protein [Candidatus Paceibacterota bacterium]
MVEFDDDKQKKKVKELYKLEEEELAQELSEKYEMGYLDLSTISINTDALGIVPEEKAHEAKVAIFNMVGKKLQVAVQAPQNEKTIETLRELKTRGYECTLFLVSNASLEKAWSRYKDISFAYETKAGALDISNEEIAAILKNVKTIGDVKKLIEDVLVQKKGYRISKILEIIVAGALATSASDIHIEPEEGYVRLRYRLDGVLLDILTFDRDTYSLLLSRVKLLSGLKLNIKANAQDGRFSVHIDTQNIEIRTSILPGAYSESIVLRILNPKTINVPMEELGIQPKLLKLLEHEISKPNGMILTTGPTGSGKTTTLYSFLKKIHSPEIKIITIEDPIEYHLPGIVQTQTDAEKGYTFLTGLRSALRQDPDVIMVGEIRDSETAEIAINSALTGHLVFSTLHTNDAAGSFPRLIDLGVNPKILTSAINIALAQRLVRTLCQNCKKEIPLEGETEKLIKYILSTIVSAENKIEAKTIWEAVGCEKCNGTGYKGRIGIYEAILTDQAIEKVVEENPSEREIRAAAAPQGLLTLEQDGVIKVLQGVTSLPELQRVIEIKMVS